MNNTHQYKEAEFWTRDGENITCHLCPHACTLHAGQAGLCGVRIYSNDVLLSTAYGFPSAMQIDPIEKKPLYHFLPGTKTFSIGTRGCNLSCKFCQNWHLSTRKGHDAVWVSPEHIVKKAIQADCKSIAFTYNEPIVFSEYAMAVQVLAEKAGLPCIFVTNGFITPEAREQIFKKLRAVNIDLKAFSESLYTEYTGGSLHPVLDTIEWSVRQGIHTEITTLLIPGVNDDEQMIKKECQWIIKHCGTDIPLHLSAFHPDYKMKDYPMTSRYILERSKQIAEDCGLQYVYVGNYPGFDNSTYCPVCGKKIIDRDSYRINIFTPHEHKIPIIWSLS